MADRDFVVKNGLVTGANNATFGTAVTLASNGNVGIGNTTPADKLVVAGSITATANVSAASVNASTGFYGTVQTATQGTINHNSLNNYVSDQHVAHSGVSISAGIGLTGGGTIAASRTVSVSVGNNQLVANSTGLWADQTKFDHNSLANYSVNRHIDHSAVSITAGNGLTGGGTIESNRTLTVLAGNSQLISNSSGVWANQAQFDHNSLTNYSVNRHIDHSAVSIATANGVAGGGDITSTRNLYISVGNNQLIANSTGLWVDQTKIDHNSLNNYAADRHVAHSGVSISAGIGLTGGGTIESNRTLAVLANNGITSNTTGVFVTQGTGTVVNATGVHVNSTYIGTLSANNTTYLNSKTEDNLNVNNATTATTATNLSGGSVSGTTGSFSGNLSFNSGYGSAAVAYGNRVWCRFSNTAILASGGMSSLVFGGTQVQMNFSITIPDTNYAAHFTIAVASGSTYYAPLVIGGQATTYCFLYTYGFVPSGSFSAIR